MHKHQLTSTQTITKYIAASGLSLAPLSTHCRSIPWHLHEIENDHHLPCPCDGKPQYHPDARKGTSRASEKTALRTSRLTAQFEAATTPQRITTFARVSMNSVDSLQCSGSNSNSRVDRRHRAKDLSDLALGICEPAEPAGCFGSLSGTSGVKSGDLERRCQC